MEKIKNKNIKGISNNFYILPTIFFVVLGLFIIVSFNNYNVISLMKGSLNSLFMMSSLLVSFLIFAIYYFISNCNVKHINLSHTLSTAFFLAGAIGIIYAFIKNEKYLAIICGIFAIVGLIFLVLQISFLVINKKNNYISSKNPTKFYGLVVQKFPLLGILLFSQAICCLSYLIITHPKLFYFSKKVNILLITISAIILFFITFNSTKKHVKIFDGFLFSILFSSPFVFIQIAISGLTQTAKNYYFTSAIILLSVVVILLLIKFLFFNFLPAKEMNLEENSYLKKFNAKFHLSSAIICGGILAIITLIILRQINVTAFKTLKTNGLRSIGLSLLPLVFADLIFYGVIILGAFMGILSIKSTKITIGDFSLWSLLFYSIVGFFTLIYSFKIIMLILSALCLLYSVSLILIRKSLVKDN